MMVTTGAPPEMDGDSAQHAEINTTSFGVYINAHTTSNHVANWYSQAYGTRSRLCTGRHSHVYPGVCPLANSPSDVSRENYLPRPIAEVAASNLDLLSD